MPYNFNAKNCFATYPQSAGLTKARLLEFFKSVAETVYVVVGEELHDDEGLHFHVLACWDSKVHRRDARWLDVDGFHPNIQVPRKISEVADYCKKDGDFVEEGELPKTKRDWSVVVAAETRADMMLAVKEIAPRDLVLNLEKLEYYASKRWRSEAVVYTPEFTEFTFCQELHDWWRVNLQMPVTRGRRRSLILKSPSKYGKTEWARSLGPHMYFNGKVDWNKWDDKALYIVFDDMDWKFVPNKKALFGCQKETTFNPKYGRIQTVLWGKVVIYLTNLTIHDFDGEDDWWTENVDFLTLYNKLY